MGKSSGRLRWQISRTRVQFLYTPFFSGVCVFVSKRINTIIIMHLRLFAVSNLLLQASGICWDVSHARVEKAPNKPEGAAISACSEYFK